MGQAGSGRVYCVIPIFNRIHSTLECIRCLNAQTYQPMTIIAIDGGSTDGTPARLKQEHPDVVLLEGKDLWWGGASRLGIEWALNNSASDDDFIMLINNDTTFDEHYLMTIIGHCRKEGAAFSGVVVDADEPEHIIDAGVNLDWANYHFKGLYEVPADRRPKLDCCVLPGRGTVVPIHAVRQAGNIDDVRFPHYLSDYEFSYRLRTKGGIRLGVAYDAEIHTNLERTDELPLQNARKKLPFIYTEAFSRRSKRNIWDHYYFINAHAPESLKWRLKFVLLHRQIKHSIGLVSKLYRMAAVIITPYRKAASVVRRGGSLVFGSYPISRADIDALKLDLDRLLADEIITESRHPGFYYASRPKHYIKWKYPEALELVRRARNPFNKAMRFIHSRRSGPGATSH